MNASRLDAVPREERAARLKERVYVTFTALAVLIVLRTHADEQTAGSAAITLLVSVVGVLLAGFVSDLIAHVTVHEALPTRGEFGHMLAVGRGALAAIVAPMLLFGAVGLGWMQLATALLIGQVLLIVSLALFGLLALRRVDVPWWQRLLLIVGLTAVGLAVVALELLAHL